jgi:hypothetical protein
VEIKVTLVNCSLRQALGWLQGEAQLRFSEARLNFLIIGLCGSIVDQFAEWLVQEAVIRRIFSTFGSILMLTARGKFPQPSKQRRAQLFSIFINFI